MKKNNSYLKYFLIPLSIILITVVIVGFSLNEQNIKNRVHTDTIYENIYINNVYVGGLYKHEAADNLSKQYRDELVSKNIRIIIDKEVMASFSYTDVNPEFDFSDNIDTAYSYAREGSIRERYKQIKLIEQDKLYIEEDPKYKYDITAIHDKLLELEQLLYIKPENAAMSIQDGRFIITEATLGRQLNVEKALENIVLLLDSREGGDVELSTEELEPKFTKEDLENSKDLIGSFVTKYAEGQNGRNTNIKTASFNINNRMIYPGEEFSTNEAFGPNTYENGYAMAGVIVAGEIVDGIGGGVCQVSSTLYNALLYAELDITERRNHSLKVGYIDYGLDATLAEGYIDLKFVNNTDYPVLIESYAQNGEVRVNIYGQETRPNN